MIRWCEALRAPEVAKWQHKYRNVWDATHGRSERAERTVWETSLEMARFDYYAGERDQGSITLVLHLALLQSAHSTEDCRGTAGNSNDKLPSSILAESRSGFRRSQVPQWVLTMTLNSSNIRWSAVVTVVQARLKTNSIRSNLNCSQHSSAITFG